MRRLNYNQEIVFAGWLTLWVAYALMLDIHPSVVLLGVMFLLLALVIERL